eukprot:NODE_7522_length_562_cov_248.684211_g6501_i0.p3 GENE.NODE_7522_length_562_cov_248.684211_g6501_i0~~NODE_7522_length_562_cov_248.684211_g6501_i0.p3  ORF type:complete len:52 (+),score=10.04 NODE_7522_length_562_cov_248.684211_g6501_i0:300-455(+)
MIPCGVQSPAADPLQSAVSSWSPVECSLLLLVPCEVQSPAADPLWTTVSNS